MTKLCGVCAKTKPLGDFYKRADRDGYRSACKRCYFLQSKRNRRALHDADPVEARRRYREDNMWILYKLTQADFDALLEAQGGGCAVCGARPNGKRLNVDHDHNCCPGPRSCGKCVRGLLCHHCNIALERVDAVPDWATRVIEYLAPKACPGARFLDSHIEDIQRRVNA